MPPRLDLPSWCSPTTRSPRSTPPSSTASATWTRSGSGRPPTPSSTSWRTTSRRRVVPGPAADRAGRAARGCSTRRRPRRRSRWPRSSPTRDRLVVPNATHWQHPGFLAYFATTASAARDPRRDGRRAALGQNPMLWRTSPIGTELEEVVVGWLREALGLPPAFDGLLTDTASTSTLIALAAAREAAGLDASAHGLAGRPEVGRPVVYASAEAHTSIEKACMTLGLGRAACRRIPVDDDYEMEVDALAAADRARIAPPAGGRSPSWRRSGPPRRPPSIPWPPSRTSPRARACGSTSTRRTPAWSRSSRSGAGRSPAGSAPTRSSSTRTSGSSRRSTRRSCCPAAWTSCGRRSASCRSTCARSTGRARSTTTRSTSRSSAAGCARSSCGLQLRWFGLEGLRRRIDAPLRARGGARGLGRRRPGLGAPGAGAVLHGLLPLAAGVARRPRGRAGGRARTWTR